MKTGMDMKAPQGRRAAVPSPARPAQRYFLVTNFVATGVAQPLLISTLGYNGAYDRSTLLFLLPPTTWA